MIFIIIIISSLALALHRDFGIVVMAKSKPRFSKLSKLKVHVDKYRQRQRQRNFKHLWIRAIKTKTIQKIA